MSGSFGSQTQKNSSKTNETVTRTPLGAQAPAWQSIWDQAGKMAGTDMSAALAPTSEAYTKVGQDGMGSSDAVRKLGLDTVNGRYLSPDEYLNPAIDAATRETWRKFEEETLPSLGLYGNNSGAYGGARNSIAAGRAAGDAFQSSEDMAARMAYENYQAERARQMAGAGLLTDATSLGGQSAGYLGEGATIQDQGQMAKLQALAEILAAGNFGTQAGTQNTTGKNSSKGFSLGFTL